MADHPKLMSLHEAKAAGIVRVRRPIWSNAMDHLELTVLPGGDLGPWVKLWCPFNLECNGKDPMQLLAGLDLSTDSREFVEYTGPTGESPEYLAERARFDGCLGRR